MATGRVDWLKSALKNYSDFVCSHPGLVIFLMIFTGFAVPFAILYQLDANWFNLTWKGRTFFLFFLWLVIMELILDWEKFQARRQSALKTVRTVVLGVALFLPTLYVLAENYFGLAAVVANVSQQFGVPHFGWMALSIEYLVFTGLFCVIMLLAYGLDGLKWFSISAAFLGAVGVVYLIDNLYPYGRFAPLQVFVPPTAWLAAGLLNLMGYQTIMTQIVNHPTYGSMPYLTVQDTLGRTANFAIAWPCSGVQSLFIYTIVMALFLKRTPIRWLHRIIYFAVGATVTYFINILRIATIFIIAINNGDWALFHNYYGELFAMTWIIAYPLIIISSRVLWNRFKARTHPNEHSEALECPTIDRSDSSVPGLA